MSADYHYVCEMLLDGKRLHFLWYSANGDGVVLDHQNRLMTFESTESAMKYADSRRLNAVLYDNVSYDFDQILMWCASPVAEAVNCKLFLDSWNMLHDVATSQRSTGKFHALDSGQQLLPIYEKLFFGNNLRSVTPDGQQYLPAWNTDELTSMSSLFRIGIQELLRP